MADDKKDLEFRDGSIIASTRIAAVYFDVSAATLSNWMKIGCPRLSYGFWDIRAVTEWRANKEGEKLSEVARSDPEKLTPAQQKIHYEAQLKEAQLTATRLRNDIATGQYLEKSAVVEDLAKFFVVLKSSIIGLGREVGQLASPYMDVDAVRQMDRMIEDRISDALEQMSVCGVYNAKAMEESD